MALKYIYILMCIIYFHSQTMFANIFTFPIVAFSLEIKARESSAQLYSIFWAHIWRINGEALVFCLTLRFPVSQCLVSFSPHQHQDCIRSHSKDSFSISVSSDEKFPPSGLWAKRKDLCQNGTYCCHLIDKKKFGSSCTLACVFLFITFFHLKTSAYQANHVSIFEHWKTSGVGGADNMK